MNNTTNTAANKLIDLTAERAVLGSCLIDPECVVKLSGFLSDSDFFRAEHETVFAAMLSLNMKHTPCDMVTLAAELERTGKLDDAGGYAGLSDLMTDVPTALYAEHYARIVSDLATKRRLFAAAGKIAELAYDDEAEVKEMLDKAEATLFQVGGNLTGGDLHHVRSAVKATVDRVDYLARNKHALMGVPTGFTMLDRMLGGLQKSDLIILAGRPGMGKTAWALSVALSAAKKHNAKVAIFSLEMSVDQLTQRLISMESNIDSHRIRLGQIQDDEWDQFLEASNEIAGLNLYIDDTPSATVNEIRSKARRLYAEHGIDLIVIDYMQLMDGMTNKNGKAQQENRTQEVSFISRSLKKLARELNVPVIALSQLSRAVESRADKRPMLSDLRESGSLEQDADIVLFIYRDDYYDEDSDKQNVADVLVAKHRHGATGTVSLFFRKELTQFRDLETQREYLN
jgi:replicative DNA helicase